MAGDKPYISTKVIAQLSKLKVTTEDVLDVWTTGESVILPSGEQGMKKTYPNWGTLMLEYATRYEGGYMIRRVWIDGKR